MSDYAALWTGTQNIVGIIIKQKHYLNIYIPQTYVL